MKGNFSGYQKWRQHTETKDQFRELIHSLSESYGKVVILIDEYDKPIIDYLGKDITQAKEHQGIMRSFYSVIKDADPLIEFFLITGISKFSKVSLFSDLNNLYDLSIDQNYSTLLGYTQEELEAYFSSYFPKVMQRKNITSREEFLQQVRLWYNGYSWDGRHFVYNPFSILSFFQNGDFYNFWFESGTPSFLLELMKSQNFYKVEGLEVDALTFAGYDIEHLQSLPVLFQTGYLTIKSRTDLGLYVLDYPNKEVRDAMYGHILGDLRNDQPGFSAVFMVELRKAFYANDIETVIDVIKSLFARIPYQIFIANQEAYYHSLLYIAFQFLGSYTVETEVSTNRGRIDAVVHTPTDIYVIEFKLDKPAEAALEQIRQKKYYEKYTHSGKPIHLLGIGFSSEAKSVADWKEERV
ncbi:MAG: AAA family ATPase [Bacteroidia bacterium]|nr:AAA family ATPase [Bacteroidia bacterium]